MRIPEPNPLMEDVEQCILYNQYASDPKVLNEYVDLYTRLIGVTSGTIVDLGSGSCNFVIALAQKYSNLKFVCYESSKEMQQIALVNIERNNLASRVTLVQDDLHNAYGEYEVVLANRVLHHIEDTTKFWKTINRLSNSMLVVDINRPPPEVINNITCPDPVYKADVVNSMRASYSLEEVWQQVKSYKYTVMATNDYKLIVYQKR
jgi:predicted RNA methylase